MVDRAVWVLHANKGDAEEYLLGHGIAALGWPHLRDLDRLELTREAFKARLREQQPNDSEAQIASHVTRLLPFVHHVRIGDLIAYWKRDHLHVGEVTGPYRYSESHSEYRQQRPVRWLGRVESTAIDDDTKKIMRKQSSFYEIDGQAAERIRQIAGALQSIQQ